MSGSMYACVHAVPLSALSAHCSLLCSYTLSRTLSLFFLACIDHTVSTFFLALFVLHARSSLLAFLKLAPHFSLFSFVRVASMFCRFTLLCSYFRSSLCWPYYTDFLYPHCSLLCAQHSVILPCFAHT